MMKTYVGHDELVILNTNTQDGISRFDSKDHRYVITIKTQLLSSQSNHCQKKLQKRNPDNLKLKWLLWFNSWNFGGLVKKFWQTKSTSSDQHQSADRHT